MWENKSSALNALENAVRTSQSISASRHPKSLLSSSLWTNPCSRFIAVYQFVVDVVVRFIDAYPLLGFGLSSFVPGWNC